MADSITITERNQPFIKVGTLLTAILTVVSFVIFWEISDPLWISIFRFSSFIFFAITVFGYLRLMNKPLTIILESSDDRLKIFYQKKDEIIQEEEFDRTKVKQVCPVSPNTYFFSSFFQSDSQTLEIHFTDTSNKLNLFEFGGRPLFFDPNTIQEVTNFLQEKNIKV